jgi:hypothetical protein
MVITINLVQKWSIHHLDLKKKAFLHSLILEDIEPSRVTDLQYP